MKDRAIIALILACFVFLIVVPIVSAKQPISTPGRGDECPACLRSLYRTGYDETQLAENIDEWDYYREYLRDSDRYIVDVDDLRELCYAAFSAGYLKAKEGVDEDQAADDFVDDILPDFGY